MEIARIVIGYHGCDRATADRLLGGEPFRESKNDYDWLGSGVYFWEYGIDRATSFAWANVARRRASHAACVGAVIDLGRCFDLMDRGATRRLSAAYVAFERSIRSKGLAMPSNGGTTPDLKRRRLDCAVLNWYCEFAAKRGEVHDTVRCSFAEGEPAFPGSKIYTETHVQIAVRDPRCILGVFRPTMGVR